MKEVLCSSHCICAVVTQQKHSEWTLVILSTQRHTVSCFNDNGILPSLTPIWQKTMTMMTFLSGSRALSEHVSRFIFTHTDWSRQIRHQNETVTGRQVLLYEKITAKKWFRISQPLLLLSSKSACDIFFLQVLSSLNQVLCLFFKQCEDIPEHNIHAHTDEQSAAGWNDIIRNHSFSQWLPTCCISPMQHNFSSSVCTVRCQHDIWQMNLFNMNHQLAS